MTTETDEERLHRICCSARDTYFNEEQAGKLPNLALIIRDAALDYAAKWQRERAEPVPAVVAAARALVPFLIEGWGEQDDPEDQEKANAACNALIAAVRAAPAQNERDEITQYVPAAQAILDAPPNPANIISKHKGETGYSVYEAWARRCAKFIVDAALRGRGGA